MLYIQVLLVGMVKSEKKTNKVLMQPHLYNYKFIRGIFVITITTKYFPTWELCCTAMIQILATFPQIVVDSEIKLIATQLPD